MRQTTPRCCSGPSSPHLTMKGKHGSSFWRPTRKPQRLAGPHVSRQFSGEARPAAAAQREYVAACLLAPDNVIVRDRLGEFYLRYRPDRLRTANLDGGSRQAPPRLPLGQSQILEPRLWCHGHARVRGNRHFDTHGPGYGKNSRRLVLVPGSGAGDRGDPPHPRAPGLCVLAAPAGSAQARRRPGRPGGPFPSTRSGERGRWTARRRPVISTGSQPTGSGGDRDRQSRGNAFLLPEAQQLGGIETEAGFADFCRSHAALSAAFLAKGWIRAAAELEDRAEGDALDPVWFRYGMAKCLDHARGTEAASRWLDPVVGNAPELVLLRAEFDFAIGRKAEGLDRVRTIHRDLSAAGERASFLLILDHLERGELDAAEQIRREQPGFATSQTGAELGGRIALLRGNQGEAEKFFTPWKKFPRKPNSSSRNERSTPGTSPPPGPLPRTW